VTSHKCIFSSALASLVLALTGCGGGSPTPPPVQPVTVALSPAPPTALTVDATTSFTAVVANDPNNGGVTWSVTCSASSCGTFSSAKTASGIATTYTAPSSPTNVSVTATSVTNTSVSASATVTVSAPGLSVSLTPAPPGSLPLGATTPLTAVVANDPSNGGVTWSVTCSASSCGTFNPTKTASGAATTYTAPPSPTTVTVTATSVTNTSVFASAPIAIATTLASGTYVFNIAGWDNPGQSVYYVGGSFAAQNGLITGGEEDYTDANYISQYPINPSGSSITSNGDGTYKITVALSSGQNPTPPQGVNGVETFIATPVTGSHLLMSQFDPSAAGTGTLDLQTSSAMPSGAYAFSTSGSDTQGNFLGIGGILDFAGGVLSPASVFDYNDSGAVLQKQTFASGSVTTPDAYGRVVITLTPTSTSVSSVSFAGYIVGANAIQLVESTDKLNGIMGGTALGQGTTPFNPAAVPGTSYVIGAAAGADASGQAQLAGSLSLNPGGSVTGTLFLADFLNISGGTIVSGTYTVDPTGRVTISNVTDNQSINFDLQLYLDGHGNAMELGVDTSEVTQGPAFQQTVSSFQNANYALAGIGYGNATVVPTWSAVGPVAFTSGSFTGTTYFNVNLSNGTPGVPTPQLPIVGTANASVGFDQGTITGLDPISGPSNPEDYYYFVVDSTRVVGLNVDSNSANLGLVFFQTAP
jgi:hypothetical protein